MQRLIAIVVFLFLLSHDISAQGMRFGFQASPTFFWLDTDDKLVNQSGTNLGLKLGVKGESFFAEKYAFTYGIGFAFNSGGTLLHDNGGRFWTKSDLTNESYRELPDGVKLKYDIRYVEMPFSFKMLTNEIFRDFRFFFEAPVITLGVRTQARGDISSAGEKNVEEENIKEDVNLFNLSWGLGAGAEYNIRGNSAGDTNLMFGIFYDQGFTDVTDNDAVKYVVGDNGVDIVEEPEDSRAVIRGFRIYLGVMF
ncbi:MAG: PorT family protein [Bacteroidetes bacterium]|nr:PorT family protein [Bacteroidota bacterium]